MNDRQLTYLGDRTDDIVEQIVGPTLLGQLLTIFAADYDAETDVTTAYVRPTTQPELDTFRETFRAPLALGGRP